MKEEDKEEIRSSLDDILGYDLPEEVPGLNDVPELSRVQEKLPAVSVEDKSKQKAKKIMDKLLRFYLSEDIIEEQEYIRAKAELDNAALGALIKQMENSERAINKLMETIFEGDVAPRMFEVLSDLQRTMLDIIKSQTMYMVAIEENAKKMAREIDIYQNSGSAATEAQQKSGGAKSRGTKDLMRALQNTISIEEAQDVDSVEDKAIDEHTEGYEDEDGDD